MNSIKALAVILAISCILITVLIAWKTNILKENGDNSKYSFSKFQLLLWSCIIIPAFILNWAYYRDFGNPGVEITELILLGISVSSTTTSQIIKAAHMTPQNRKLLDSYVESDLKATTLSESFWKDIFSDDHGNFSIGRLQNFLFTIIYVFIYITLFFKKSCDYPVFEQTAFILMGISTGGYLVAKGNKQ